MTLPLVQAGLPPAGIVASFAAPGPMRPVRSYRPIDIGLPRNSGGLAPALPVSRPAQRSLALRPACSPSRHATLFTEGFNGFVTSTAASIVTGRSEPAPGRDFHPLWTSSFSRRTELSGLNFPLLHRDFWQSDNEKTCLALRCFSAGTQLPAPVIHVFDAKGRFRDTVLFSLASRSRLPNAAAMSPDEILRPSAE